MAALMSCIPAGSTERAGVEIGFSDTFGGGFLRLMGPSSATFFSSGLEIGFGIQGRISPRAKALHNVTKIVVSLNKDKQKMRKQIKLRL